MLITPAAQNKLRELLPQPDRAYRLRAIPGGCQGYTYDLKIIQNPTADDVRQSFPNLPIYIDRASLPYFQEVVLDYTEGLINSGFVFHHPASCSCGKSFAPDQCPSQ
ncbi:MAG: iron-sulfur cluster assembly accessory protein [Pseudanabaenaceae cyanobacterium SKYGB_i_bin29]|nr:iron-sulfur cluster assembly accessory protein [Pseudanabaenaceae cyanobacterium SKYG29]MDW8422239.1 iron-sulfur cluster assembly accessory protein [Pseudanabaenaceae cyanobacterium SKYGB_i_bin29]